MRKNSLFISSLKVILLAILTGSAMVSNGQIPGQIFTQRTSLLPALDPNGDGYITTTGAPFPNGEAELNYFENSWTSKFQLTTEPIGDASTGNTCSQVDIVDANNNQLAYFTGIYDPDGYPTNNDGDEYFLGRIRIGGDPGTANFGYSILLDVDLLFGQGNDPNYIAGNAGFEVEIRLVNGGGSKGVFVDNVNGTTKGTTVASYGYLTNHCKSYAKYTNPNCPASRQTPVFVDVAIPFSVLTSNFGITPYSKIRIAAATSTNGASILGSNGSDLAGLNDKNYSSFEGAVAAIVDNQPASPLPVELLNFTAALAREGIWMKWRTATEIENSHFVIEHMTQGSDFLPIGEVEGFGNSFSIQNYEFIHATPSEGMNFYRLKQVDFNGDFEYSSIVAINGGETGLPGAVAEFSYDNVTRKGMLNLGHTAVDAERILLFDIQGRHFPVTIYGGGKQISIDCSTLERGIYILQVADPGLSKSFRFMVF